MHICPQMAQKCWCRKICEPGQPTLLCQYCPSIVPVLCQYCPSIVPVFCQYCACIFPVLCQCCPSIVPVLSQYCAYILPVLCLYFTSIVPVLSQYCGSIVAVLCQYYVIRALHRPLPPRCTALIVHSTIEVCTETSYTTYGWNLSVCVLCIKMVIFSGSLRQFCGNFRKGMVKVRHSTWITWFVE